MTPGATFKVTRSVDLDGLLKRTRKAFFNRAMLIIHKNAVIWAPVQQKQMGRGSGATGKGNRLSGGYLRGSMAPGNGITRAGDDFALVGTNARYGVYLDDNKKTGKYHYRSGPHMGSVTTAWLGDVGKRTENELQAALKRSADELETGWKRG